MCSIGGAAKEGLSHCHMMVHAFWDFMKIGTGEGLVHKLHQALGDILKSQDVTYGAEPHSIPCFFCDNIAF